MSRSHVSSGFLKGTLTPARPIGSGRAQTSVELLVILAISLILVAVVINFTVEKLGELRRQHDVRVAQQAMDELVAGINRTFAQGPGSVGVAEVSWPQGLDANEATLDQHSIRIRLYGTDVVGTAVPRVSGSVSTTPGTHRVRMAASASEVVLGSDLFSVSASNLYVPMSRDSNQTSRIVLTNHSPEAASIALALTWSATAVGASLSPSSGTLPPGGTFAFDFRANAGAGALGNYVGSIRITATYPSGVETRIIPVNVEVFPSSSSILSTVPLTLDFTNYQTDQNQQTLQVCNTANTALSTISFTPSTGNAGDWVQGISDISSLPANSCTNVQVIVVPAPLSEGESVVATGTYTGSLLIKDFSGANSVIVPLSVHIQGMSDFLVWDWLPTVSTGNALTAFELYNLEDKYLSVTHLSLSLWDACDTEHSNITEVVLNSKHFTPVTGEENEDIPIIGEFFDQTTWTDNSITFDGTIDDENEQLRAQVTMGDGTVFTSDVYGPGCGADLVAPARVTDLNATTGPEPGSILLSWTYPGDDNASGTPSSAVLKYSFGNVNTGPLFSAAAEYPLTAMLPGGSAGSLLVSDFNVGYTYKFALTFKDEADNNGGISNQVSVRPWNRYQYTKGDFNISNWINSLSSVSGDASDFTISDLATGGGRDRNIVLRAVQDSNSLHSWIAYLNFDTSNLTRIKIWYPGNGATGIPSTTPQYDQTFSQPIATPISLLDGNLVTGGYGYGGSAVLIGNPAHLYLDILRGFTDMNIRADRAADAGEGGGPIGQ